MMIFVGAPLFVLQQSAVTVSSNKFVSVAMTETTQEPFISPMVACFCLDYLRMSGASLFALNGNGVEDSKFQINSVTVSGIFFNAIADPYLSQLSSIEANASTVTLNNNFVASSDIDSLILVKIWHNDGPALIVNSTVSMSGNGLDAATTINAIQMCVWDLRFSSVRASDNSAIQVNNNSMLLNPNNSLTGTSSTLYVYASVFQPSIYEVTASSTFNVSGNVASWAWWASGKMSLVQFDVTELTVSNNSAFLIQQFHQISIEGQFTAFLSSLPRSVVSVQSTSNFTVTDNFAYLQGGCNYSVLSVVSLSLGGRIQIERNSFQNSEPQGSIFMFIQASAFTESPSATIVACNNSLSWENNGLSNTAPGPYLSPPSLAAAALLCVPAQPQPDSHGPTRLIIGVVVGSVAALVMIIGVVLLVRARRHQVPSDEPLMNQEAVKTYGGVQE